MLRWESSFIYVVEVTRYNVWWFRFLRKLENSLQYREPQLKPFLLRPFPLQLLPTFLCKLSQGYMESLYSDFLSAQLLLTLMHSFGLMKYQSFVRWHRKVLKEQFFKPNCLGSNSSSVVYLLCDLG